MNIEANLEPVSQPAMTQLPSPTTMADIPFGVALPRTVQVLADRAYDSDPLRASLRREGYRLVVRHRENRTRPATPDGRELRRLARRWVVERTMSWLKSFRRVATRYERRADLYDGFVHLACAFLALGKLW